MTVVIAKTPAETSLLADFNERKSQLPGGGAVLAARTDAMASFVRMGLPHRRVEAWKYSDLRAALTAIAPIATRDDTAVSAAEVTTALKGLALVDADRIVFVNGAHRPDLSSVESASSITTFGADLRANKPASLPPTTAHEAVAALNVALATDGAHIAVARDKRPSKPIMIVMVAAGAQPKLTSLRHHVTLAPETTASVIEAHVTVTGAAAGQSNSVFEIALGDGASLTHTLVCLEGSRARGAGVSPATHIETIAATLGANATLTSFQLTAGTGFVRNQSFVTFTGAHAKLDISGLMLGRERDHIDTTLVIDHAVPNCESRELFKTVLDDTARAVFQGKVIVRPDAQKTDGKQMAKALMLSEACEFDSKPELEIYADDVVCGHGATVAEIDPAMMFYLRSRGIPKDEARALLIESFVGEALEKIESETLRETLSEIARAWLAAGAKP